MPPFLLVEAPRLLFPFARQIIADASQNTGFPPLLLDPIDFAAAYWRSSRRAAGAGREANGETGRETTGDAEPTDAPATPEPATAQARADEPASRRPARSAA